MKILIISGGSIDEMWGRKWVADYEPDYCIAADSGLVMADKLGLTVDLLLGDYDSVDKKIFEKYSLGMKQRLGIAMRFHSFPICNLSVRKRLHRHSSCTEKGNRKNKKIAGHVKRRYRG